MGTSAAARRALHSVLPTLSQRTRVILDALLTGDGSMGSVRAAAERMGLRNRFALARLLRADGLPPPRELADWVRMLLWVTDYERRPVSLFRLAIRYHRSPAVCYRTVKRLTGLRWTDVRARGVSWVLRTFLHRCTELNGGG